MQNFNVCHLVHGCQSSDTRNSAILRLVFVRPYCRSSLWYSVSSVCLSSVCDVLYCGETVRPSKKLSEGVNSKPGSKSSFFGVAAIFLLPVSPLRPPRRPFLPYFCSYSPAIGTRLLKLTFYQKTMCVLSDCVVRIENGLCVIRFHYVV